MSATTLQHWQSLLQYDRDTGIFNWRVPNGRRVMLGDVAGTKNARGYICITHAGKTHKAHRLAWLFVRGCWPVGEIDHINGIRHDNRAVNLRECTTGQNQQNRKLNKNSTSGYMGVSWHKGKQKWQARIQLNNRMVQLGNFSSAEEAHRVYLEAKRSMHTFNPEPREPRRTRICY